jgi:hypothetical protein
MLGFATPLMIDTVTDTAKNFFARLVHLNLKQGQMRY